MKSPALQLTLLSPFAFLLCLHQPPLKLKPNPTQTPLQHFPQEAPPPQEPSDLRHCSFLLRPPFPRFSLSDSTGLVSPRRLARLVAISARCPRCRTCSGGAASGRRSWWSSRAPPRAWARPPPRPCSAPTPGGPAGEKENSVRGRVGGGWVRRGKTGQSQELRPETARAPS